MDLSAGCSGGGEHLHACRQAARPSLPEVGHQEGLEQEGPLPLLVGRREARPGLLGKGLEPVPAQAQPQRPLQRLQGVCCGHAAPAGMLRLSESPASGRVPLLQADSRPAALDAAGCAAQGLEILALPLRADH